MADGSSIEWTEATWNPIRGCSRVSAGCLNCYAESQAARWSGPGQPYEGLIKLGDHGPTWSGVVRFIPEHLDDPLRWKRPRRIFVNSMSDLFHEGLAVSLIAKIFGVMGAATQHSFQVLTKRAERMHDLLNRPTFRKEVADEVASAWWRKHGEGKPISSEYPKVQNGPAWPLPNVWLGVSVENQETADARIPHLIQTPARVRWLSVEPLIGQVSLEKWFQVRPGIDVDINGDAWAGGNADATRAFHWIVVGGESGPGARFMESSWAERVVEEARAAKVPVFVKQLGEVLARRLNVQSRKGGDLHELPLELRVREYPHPEAFGIPR